MVAGQNHPYRAVFHADPLGLLKYQKEGMGFGFVHACHKKATTEIPHRVANEFIAGEIGRYIGLPIPPVGLTHYDDGQGNLDALFTSLDFNHERDKLPPIDPPSCISRLPNLAAGILAFDILIANGDRHEYNLWCDKAASPKRIIVYDHDVALLATSNDGVPRLTSDRDGLGLSYSGGVNPFHCFLDVLPSVRLFDKWLKRIYAIPDWYVEQLCETARQHLPKFDKKTAKAIASFLTHRRKNLEHIILQNKQAFASVTDWQPDGLF